MKADLICQNLPENIEDTGSKIGNAAWINNVKKQLTYSSDLNFQQKQDVKNYKKEEKPED